MSAIRAGGSELRANSIAPGVRSVARLALRLNRMMCIAVVLVILAYCLAEEGKAALAVVSLAVCAVGWHIGRGRRDAGGRYNGRPRAVPRLLVNLLVVAALIDATFKVIGSGTSLMQMGTPIVSVLAQFLVYIQLIKLFDRRAPRDEAHVIGLSIFIAIGAILTSNQLLVGLLLFIYTPLAITSAMMLQILGGQRMTEAAERDALLLSVPNPLAQVAPDGMPDQNFSSTRTHRRDFRVAGGLAVAATVTLATLAFVLMPRGLGENLLGAFGRVAEGTQIGFTDQIKLGRTGRLQSDDTPVMDVRIKDSRDNDISEQMQQVYLRGTVRNYYNREKRSWESQTSPAGRAAMNDDPDWIAGPDRPVPLGQKGPATGVVRVELSYRRGLPVNGYIFTVWRPLKIVDMSLRTTIHRWRDDLVINGTVQDGQSGAFRYSIESAPEYVDITEEDRVDVSFPSEKVRELAESLLAARAVPLDAVDRTPDLVRRAVVAFMDHLRTSCVYTTELTGTNEGEDPIDMFLFRTQQGHCEYFASALVAMCQSVGIDARLVAGYLAAEYSGLSSGYVVRESNAHAWAEVRIAKGRWQRFDPSPPDAVSAEHRPSGGIFSRLRQYYEALNFTWTNAVVTFDQSKQSGLVGSRSQNYFRNWTEFLRKADPRDWLRRTNGPEIARWAAIGVGFVGLLILARRAWIARGPRRSRRRSVHAASELHDPELRQLLERAKFYARLLSVLSRAGFAKPDHRPPLSHAGAMGASVPEAGADTAELSRLYYQVRFGRRDLSAQQASEAERLLARVERSLAEAAARKAHA